ncbi:lipoprotein BA_5634 family protein [Thermoactinomyces sp. DSM 45891]|uniref:lipoprotein BA_5634 family protein n=1 Tax=Thermoactinomyces sp. DSM 45891 TaxID=1761907 RepID=UPI000931C79B|nr:lipoprotein BA_5634 family protein [Thermoactinomyces sp. DSM 45891]
MKKSLLIGSIGIIVITTILIGYSFFKANILYYFDRHNGAIVLGEKDKIQNMLSIEKDKISSPESYVVKVSTIDEKKILFLSKDTAEKLNKKDMLRTVKEEKVDGGMRVHTDPLNELPAVPADKGILFAREDLKAGAMKGLDSEQKMPIEYKGDLIIGSGSRFPVDASIVVVSDTAFSSVKASEYQLSLFIRNGEIRVSDQIDYNNIVMKP